MQVTIGSLGNFSSSKIVVVTEFDARLIKEPLPVSVMLDVPEDSIGPFSIVAHAYEDVTGNVAVADEVSGTVVPGATLLSLRITPDPVLLYHFSTTESLFVYGLYDDGVERNLTDPALGTMYTIDDPAIAEVSNDGLVTSISVGSTFVTASNQGVSADVDVDVLSVPLPLIGDLNDDGAVNVFDLNLMLAAWGVCEDPCPPSCPADLTNSEGMGGDCLVDTFDLLELLANWTG